MNIPNRDLLLNRDWDQYTANALRSAIEQAKQAGRDAATAFHARHGYELAHEGHFFEYYVRPNRMGVDEDEFHDWERIELVEGNSSGNHTPIEISFACAWNERMLEIMEAEDAGHRIVQPFVEWDRREDPQYFAMKDHALTDVLQAHREKRESYFQGSRRE